VGVPTKFSSDAKGAIKAKPFFCFKRDSTSEIRSKRPASSQNVEIRERDNKAIDIRVRVELQIGTIFV
jgi:hypothetical protein